MLSWPWCKTTLKRTKILATSVKASGSSSASQPPVATPLDLVLQKAARKIKLVHPAAQNDYKRKQQGESTKAKEPIKQPTHRPPASRATKQPTQKQPPQPPVNDDAIFNDITESERDSVWEAFKLEVELDSDDDDWAEEDVFGRQSLPPQRRKAPPSARDDSSSTSPRAALTTPQQPVGRTSGFKGFGTPPRRSQPSAPPSTAYTPQDSSAPSPKPRQLAPFNNSYSHTAAQPQSSATSTTPLTRARSEAKRSHPSGPSLPPQPRQAGAPVSSSSAPHLPPLSPLRVFLFNAEEARTRSLLQQLGLQERVRVVDDLRCADALVAAKLARSGKHVNLMQGERTAANLGVPFLVVGRHMSADSLRTALMPLLDAQTAGAASSTSSSQGLDDGASLAAATNGPGRRAPTAADLRAHRLEVMHGFAQMLREGPPGAGTLTATAE